MRTRVAQGLTPRGPVWIFVTVFLVALGMQALVWVNLSPEERGGDEWQYNRLAINLLNGKGFSVNGETPSVDRTPGYPIFLAGIYSVFGRSSSVVQLVQGVLWAATCLLLYWIGRIAFGYKEAALGAGLAAVYPPLAAMGFFIQTETLFAFTLMLALATLLFALQRGKMWWYVATGAILAVATYVRPTTVLLLPFLMIALPWWWKGSARRQIFGGLTVACLTMAVAFMPWVARNYYYFGRFIPLSNHGGVNFWVGSYIPGNGNYDNYITQDELMRLLAAAQGKPFTESDLRNPTWRLSVLATYSPDIDRMLYKEAWKNIRQHPIEYLALMPRKVFRLWVGSYSPFFQINLSMEQFLRQPELRREHAGTLLWKVFILGCSTGILFLGVVGIRLVGPRNAAAVLLATVIGYFTLFHIIQDAYSRLGLPAVPILILFATCAGKTYWRRRWAVSRLSLQTTEETVS